jgi:hypothetical protein
MFTRKLALHALIHGKHYLPFAAKVQIVALRIVFVKKNHFSP